MEPPGIQTDNYWPEAAPLPDIPVFDLPSETDVAVVGSGYTGLHAALELRRSGADVTVLEAETVGWGASSRNGGMVSPGMKSPLKTMVQRYGLERAGELWRWSVDAVEHVDATIRAEGIECDWRRDGHMALAYKPSHFEDMVSQAAWRRRHLGHVSDRIVEPGDLRSEIGTDAYHGGVVDSVSGGLNPARYTAGLAAAAARRGARLVERAAVTRIERSGSVFRLITEKGDLKAQNVLLATNGYTTGLKPGARNGIFPIGSYIIVTEPLPPALQEDVSPHGRMFYDTKYFLNYFRLTPDGRMLFGGRNDLTTGLDLRESARRLQARMLEIYPQLGGIPVTHSWTGKLGVTFDLMPHIGRVDGVHYAYGYAGHGVAIAGYLGREAGALLAGTIPSSMFEQIPHPRSPAARLDRLFLPFVSAYYRIVDRVR